MRMRKMRSGMRVCSRPENKVAKRKSHSVGPVGADAAWGVLVLDCGVHLATVEER
jgi:hypothetical protein